MPSCRNDIVIKPADNGGDNGGALVVWRADLYRDEAHRQQARRKLFAIGGGGLKPRAKARDWGGGSGGMLPWEIFKSRVWEMPFHGLWGKDLTEF